MFFCLLENSFSGTHVLCPDCVRFFKIDPCAGLQVCCWLCLLTWLHWLFRALLLFQCECWFFCRRCPATAHVACRVLSVSVTQDLGRKSHATSAAWVIHPQSLRMNHSWRQFSICSLEASLSCKVHFSSLVFFSLPVILSLSLPFSLSCPAFAFHFLSVTQVWKQGSTELYCLFWVSLKGQAPGALMIVWSNGIYTWNLWRLLDLGLERPDRV